MSSTSFRHETEESRDEAGSVTTTIVCHGRIVSENTAELRALVTPIMVRGGRVVLDFADIEYLDSSGLGAIVGLKVSSINRGLGELELKNLTPRVRKVLSVTNLLQLFSER